MVFKDMLWLTHVHHDDTFGNTIGIRMLCWSRGAATTDLVTFIPLTRQKRLNHCRCLFIRSG